MKANNIINFDFPADCIGLLGLLHQQKKKPEKIVEIKSGEISKDIKDKIIKSKEKGLLSLPQDIVDMIMDYYKIDHPKHANFTDKNKALEFCKEIFPSSIVMKLSSPDALHKTEMKGIFLDIKDEAQFNHSWDNLYESITKYKLENASILIQEMIFKSNEAIIGLNTDQNFGKIIVFGTGGIYTEVMDDISLRILPTNEFEKMIDETKIGKILKGVRGEEPKALDKVIDTLNKVQQIAFDFPEIVSIDINPILITKKRAVVADFKILLK